MAKLLNIDRARRQPSELRPHEADAGRSGLAILLAELAAEFETVHSALATLRGEVAELKKAKPSSLDDRPLTLLEFSKRFPDWTLGALRSALFNRHENGLARAIIQKSPRGKIRIVPSRFFEVVMSWGPGRTAAGIVRNRRA